MGHVITLSDQAYRALEEAAVSAGQTPEALVEAWAEQLGCDPEQAWFWTPEWQAGERRADEELRAGLGQYFDSEEAFLAGLDEDADV